MSSRWHTCRLLITRSQPGRATDGVIKQRRLSHPPYPFWFSGFKVRTFQRNKMLKRTESYQASNHQYTNIEPCVSRAMSFRCPRKVFTQLNWPSLLY